MTPAPPSVGDNLASVRARIDAATRAAGRDPASVRLVAVSKTRPAEDVRAAFAAGQRDFGENYVQELLAKHAELSNAPGIVWHAVGHIQTNKARQVARTADVVHSLDSVRLCEALSRAAVDAGRALVVLVQVNVGGEAQKSGCAPGELGAILDAAQSAPGLTLRGLMTVPPHTDDPAGAREFFEALRALRDAHGGAARLPELSMGMTHDLDVAVACGATMVRVGTAIFGERASRA